jgi:hypothetical protein
VVASLYASLLGAVNALVDSCLIAQNYFRAFPRDRRHIVIGK